MPGENQRGTRVRRTRRYEVVRRTRVEIGIFFRKVVDGRVVRQWHFPPLRGESEPVSDQVVVQESVGTPESQEGQPPSHFEARALEQTPRSSEDRTGSSTEEGSTSYEAGIFFRTESVSPGDYGGEGGEEPP